MTTTTTTKAVKEEDAEAALRRRAHLLSKVPDCPGVYVWLVRPPRGARRRWVPVYLGRSERLRQRLGSYLRPDGGFGPPQEPFKLRAMLDLMRRGFHVQVRFRPCKFSAAAGGAKRDESAKLAAWDFALNSVENGGRRPLELPSGRQVSEFPVVDARAARLYDAAVARERAAAVAAAAAAAAAAASGVKARPPVVALVAKAVGE